MLPPLSVMPSDLREICFGGLEGAPQFTVANPFATTELSVSFKPMCVQCILLKRKQLIHLLPPDVIHLSTRSYPSSYCPVAAGVAFIFFGILPRVESTR